MSNLEQTFLDLDELLPASVAVKYKGQSYDVVPVSVETFIANMKLIQEVGQDASPEDEIRLIVTLVNKSIPTFPAEDLYKLSLEQLRGLLEFVKKFNGETADVAKHAEVGAGDTGPLTQAP